MDFDDYKTTKNKNNTVIYGATYNSHKVNYVKQFTVQSNNKLLKNHF